MINVCRIFEVKLSICIESCIFFLNIDICLCMLK